MNANDCDELYISYLFPPSNDASGITVFKRIVENGKKVDILQGKFKAINDLDKYADSYINNRYSVDVKFNYDWTVFIFDYMEKGLNAIGNDYEKIYSRSWLMANHFLASEYKFTHPDVFWTAEFSDPLMYTLNNRVKTFKEMIIDDDDYISRVNEEIKKLNGNFPTIENGASAFFIAEYLVYLFADEVIFTNENQRRIMIDQFPVDLEDLILSKSVIKPHPTLDDKFYQIKNSKLDLDNNYINIAYFGKDYYSKRHFESLFYSIEALNHKFKDKIRFYIYIEDDKIIKNLIPSDSFVVKKPLEYLEFLNATTKFDVLIINDAFTRDNFELNPYLPSKLSDYIGSGRDIWAFYEDGSTLSKLHFKYKSNIESYDDCLNQLVRILEDRGFHDENYSIDENYIYTRLTRLNELYEKEFRRREKLKKELNNLKNENKDIKSSNSWRITKPLRKIRK